MFANVTIILFEEHLGRWSRMPPWADAAFAPLLEGHPLEVLVDNAAAGAGPWQHVGTEAGVELYEHELPGERVVELKAVTVPGGGCRQRFFAESAAAPPPVEGLVRIEKLRGSWTFEPADGGVVLRCHGLEVGAVSRARRQCSSALPFSIATRRRPRRRVRLNRLAEPRHRSRWPASRFACSPCCRGVALA